MACCEKVGLQAPKAETTAGEHLFRDVESSSALALLRVGAGAAVLL